MITANNAYTYIFNYGYALGKDCQPRANKFARL